MLCIAKCVSNATNHLCKWVSLWNHLPKYRLLYWRSIISTCLSSREDDTLALCISHNLQTSHQYVLEKVIHCIREYQCSQNRNHKAWISCYWEVHSRLLYHGVRSVGSNYAYAKHHDKGLWVYAKLAVPVTPWHHIWLGDRKEYHLSRAHWQYLSIAHHLLFEQVMLRILLQYSHVH